MSLVLGIDTAAPVVGAAVIGPDIERSWSERNVRGADGVLIPAIADMIRDLNGLDAVAVSVGPGAFTGLRVGVATALGFAVSMGCSVVCVSSLEARAYQASHGRVLSLLDARKSRVYAQVFDGTGPLPIALSGPVDAPISEVLPNAPFLATGEGALLDRESIERSGGTVDVDPGRSPAMAVARIGLSRLHEAVHPNEVALAYLREADAKKSKQQTRQR